jgi:hypothetical protein
MWDFLLVVFKPNQLNPGNVMLIVELMKMFNEEGIILQSKVKNPEPTSMLWYLDCLPGY